jgi:hypothetical protein
MKQYNLVSDCCNSKTKRKGEFTFCENCRQKCVLVKVKINGNNQTKM